MQAEPLKSFPDTTLNLNLINGLKDVYFDFNHMFNEHLCIQGTP